MSKAELRRARRALKTWVNGRHRGFVVYVHESGDVSIKVSKRVERREQYSGRHQVCFQRDYSAWATVRAWDLRDNPKQWRKYMAMTLRELRAYARKLRAAAAP